MVFLSYVAVSVTHHYSYRHSTLCLFLVNLSDGYPTDQPTLVLQSVYHRFQGIPCLSVIKDYPYSPRWNADEMAERMR